MEQFKCPICKNEYSQANPPRILTMCGHSFCHFCIKNLIKRKDYKYVVRCPEDRSKISIDSNSASFFPKNIALLQAFRRNANKNKQEYGQQSYDFLLNISEQQKTVPKHESKCSYSDLKQTLLSRRTSCQEGMCLLHRKPLDIVCLEQKIHICAECALFGLHKGHNFTTIKDLAQKKQEWSHQIKEIIEEKKHIDTKILNGQIQKEVMLILKKKKDLLSEQIESYINRVKQKIYQYQRSIKIELQQQMETLQNELKKVMAIHPQVEKEFVEWVQKVEFKRYKIIEEDQLNMIILENEDQKLRLEGEKMLQNIKKQLINFWSKIENVLQYPKVQYSPIIEKQLPNLIQFLKQQPKHIKNQQISIQITKLEDQTIIQQKKNEPIFDEVSLLDISARYKYGQNQQELAVNFSQISLIDSFEFQNNENIQQSQIFIGKKLSKVKSIETNLVDKSLISSIQQKMKYRSPKQRVKTQMFSKKNICSIIPVSSSKMKLKRFTLKTKEPQKFQKIITNLQSDSINSIDFTGFEMGDEVVKEICIKILDCKKPKLLRLMKNNLTDQSGKEIVESLKVIDYLNLAQNNFTQKILDIIIDLSKKGQIGKNKTIQLGQNRLNPRKYKTKIQQLKKLGVIITL